ncbi:50S ribosomal protein L22 [bacterium DOLZORAL124_38_8]|nr:MAG: 50S ribosomal protein L22 [bacterium DOLZORAL124_38_8]
MKAHLRGIRMSPKKANIVAGLVRGMNAEKALDVLRFTANKPAQVLLKVLKSAVANAEHNDGKNRSNLVIESLIINKGPVYKRYLPSTRGRALPLRKPTTHITIELAETK